MKLTDALLGEHGAIHVLVAHVANRMEGMSTPAEVRAASAMLQEVLDAHARTEEELLFPALERQMGPGGPLAVMRSEHKALEQALADTARAADREAAVAALRRVLQIVQAHFAKEEQVLFQMAEAALGERALEDLTLRWADTRNIAAP